MNRTFKPNRQGITLLFVISMIVLFLLMGTAFVIVANTYKRESTNRILSNLQEDKGSEQSNQLLAEAMRQIIRGTDLRDIESPLRVNDYLSDQYGFGVKSFVAGTNRPPQMVGGGAFLEISLTSNPGTNPSTTSSNDNAFNLLTLSTTPDALDTTGLDNDYGGRVLSFTSGPAKGFSARIYSDYFDSSGVHVFRVPAVSVTGDIITNAMVTSATFPGSEVIINGRDFSGTGADAQLDASFNPTGLGAQALLPNRVGQSFSNLVGLSGASATAPYLVSTHPTNGVQSLSASVNEPWDAADISTMFLSGFDKQGNLIPSFYRQALLDSSQGVSTLSSGRKFFHAFDEGGDDLPDVDTDGEGTKDAYWMDLGNATSTTRDGKLYKPLFAIQIIDMEGRLNVNAHSNRTHLLTDGYVDKEQTWTSGDPRAPRGLGMGPADIDLRLPVSGTGRLTQILDRRYGPDNLPGNGVTSFRSRAELFGYPDDEINTGGNQFGTVGGLFAGSPMDIHGRFKLGSPISSNSGFDNFTDLNYAAFNNSIPVINVISTDDIDSFTDEFSGNQYEMTLSGRATGDLPFTPEELERVLRPGDIDSQVLPDRLSSVLDGLFNSRIFTTDSYDVPMLYRSFVEEVLRELPKRGGNLNTAGIRTLLDIDQQFAFAPELFRGQKMDINRPLGDGIDNNNNGTTDEPGEIAVNQDALSVLGAGNEIIMDLNYGSVRPNSGSSDTNPRVIFARHLYMLAMLKLAPVNLDKSADGVVDADERLAFAKAMAQWAVNVVDFRDPDSIHTRFVYDPTPFDAQGWNPTTDAMGNPLPPAQISDVWGVERPELLLTETLAVHIQNMERNTAGDYEQRLRPEPFAYFEIYNPWTQNRLNQQFDGSLYTRFAVDLTRQAPDDSPVWRFEVERAEEPDPNDPNAPTIYKPLRYVYMADPTASPITYTDLAKNNQVASDIEIFFNSGGRTLLRPGRQALIGTEGFEIDNKFKVFMGRRTGADDMNGTSAANLMLDDTTRLEITPGNMVNPGTIERYTGGTLDSTRSAMTMFIDKSTTGVNTGADMDRKFSLSDQYEGYTDVNLKEISDGDGSVYTPAKPSSLDVEDGDRITDIDIAKIRTEDGINKNFRFVRLQRLANPLIGWDSVTNPYLTIDSMEVDLVSINGADSPDTMTLNPAETPDRAVSHERGSNNSPTTARTKFWGLQRATTIRTIPNSQAESTGHYYADKFYESLGRTNDSYNPSSNGTPFSWLTWNNRPFVSHTEIMNVPYLASDRLTYAPEVGLDPSPYPTDPFTIDDESTVTDPYGTSNPNDLPMATRNGALAGRYGHLLNFFASEDDSTNSVLDAYKLLDFIEVPSRFVGTKSFYLAAGRSDVFNHPFNTISSYRAPGKININTMPPTSGVSSTVWSALASEYASIVAYNTLRDSLYGPNATPSGPTDFMNPFRPAEAANLVPGATTQVAGSSCSFMRPQGTSTQVPLLDYTSTARTDNSFRSAAFRNGLRTRLGNLVTTKSSVFACWITVGYFEVDENNDLVTTDGTAFGTDKTRVAVPPAPVAEIGIETGEQVRNRAFFIFDRSIPVAFEPGKDHNVEKAILIESLIE